MEKEIKKILIENSKFYNDCIGNAEISSRYKRGYNKKALSLMLSYVILIVIGISLAVAVYSWLQFYAEGIEPNVQCPDDVTLIIQDYSCNLENNQINLILKNHGRHSVFGYMARGADDVSKLPTDVLDISEIGLRIESQPGKYYFKDAGGDFAALAPGKTDSAFFNYPSEYSNELKKIQIEPFIVVTDEKGKKDVIQCNQAIVSQEIDCTGHDEANYVPWVEGEEDENTPPQQEIPSSLVSWWKFENNFNDEIGINHASREGAVTFGPSQIENEMALKAEGSTDYAKMSSVPSEFKPTINDDFTIESWIKLNSIPTFEYAFIFEEYSNSNSNTNYGLKIKTDGKVVFYWAGNSILESNTALNANEWYFITLTKSGNDFKLYINYNSETKTAISSEIITYENNDVINIGMIENGLTDEVAFYNEALSASDIQKHYERTLDGAGDYFTDN